MKFSDTLIAALLESLKKRFQGLLINIGILPPVQTENGQTVDTATMNFGDPAYLVSTALDPEFKPNWLDDNDELRAAITGKCHVKFNFFVSGQNSVKFY